MIISEIIIAFVCIAFGGLLKGATGVGAPILAIPALSMMFSVQYAVVVMLVPNLLTNCWQIWRFRKERLPSSFLILFAGAGGAGSVLGSFFLASTSSRTLSQIVAICVGIYILSRVIHPNWAMSFPLARKLSAPAGFLAGVLQGVSGMSAPISLSFLNAAQLERAFFISTASFFFATMAILQIPTLSTLGILTPHRLLISILALIPLIGFMPLGSLIGNKLPKKTFDRLILILLAGMAIKLLI